MSRQFAVFDIDGTIFRSALYLEIVYKLAEQGTIKLPQDSSHLEALEAWRNRESADAYSKYLIALTVILDSQIKGMKVADFEKAVIKVIDEQVKYTYVYPRRLIKELKEKNYFLVAVSGSQVELVELFAKYWGFDAWVGQVFERHNGVFTGKITKTFDKKGKFVHEVIATHSLSLVDSYGVGDSMGDIELLEMVANPIAFNPEKELAELARQKGWPIVIERKNVDYTLKEGKDGRYYLAETN